MSDTLLNSSPPQHQNFEESQEAMKKQLLQLSILLKALDPELCDFLGQSADAHIQTKSGRRPRFLQN